MIKCFDVMALKTSSRTRPDPLEDLQLLERLYADLSARIYCTHSKKEKFRLRALQTEIEAVLEHQ